jgi:chemotaxis protein CheD
VSPRVKATLRATGEPPFDIHGAASIPVRIGELAVSRTPGTVLSAIGLGSCIGLVLMDVERRVAGLAHIMLPESRVPEREPARYADAAVPALSRALVGVGGRTRRLEAVVVGGAQLFAASQLEIGPRNSDAVAVALREAGIPVKAEAIGGTLGRSLWVSIDELSVMVRSASESPEELYRPSATVITVPARSA